MSPESEQIIKEIDEAVLRIKENNRKAREMFYL